MNRKVKLFAWDFHGTLEQGTEIGFADILRNLACDINYKVQIDLEEVRKLYGVSVLDYLKHFFPKFSNKELNKLRGKIRTAQNRKHILKFVKPAPYAHKVLIKIKEAGHKNIVVSTSTTRHIKRFLKAVNMLGLFDAIFGIDRHTLDLEFNIAEEKAKAIEKFAKENNFTKSHIIVIGDRPGDIDAGILIGARTYQYVSCDLPNVKTRAQVKITDLRELLKEI